MHQDNQQKPLYLRRLSIVLFIFLALIAYRFFLADPPPRTEVYSGLTMGTTYSIKVVTKGHSEEIRRRTHDVIEQTLDQVNDLMSTFKANSELSRFNQHRNTLPFKVSSSTLEIFQKARDIYKLSEGAFDITVAPLVRLWGFGAGANPVNKVPDRAEIERILARVGMDKLKINTHTSSLTKEVPELHCDLSAIAKGHAVDRLAEAMQRLGYNNFMVEVGGEVRTGGRNINGRSWRIGVENPIPEQRSIYGVLEIENNAMATSGDYRNFYEIDGQRFSHTIDPRSGRPIAHAVASVTVVDQECARADGLATALNVLGVENGLKVARENDIAVLFLARSQKGSIVQHMSPAFTKHKFSQINPVK